jgi:hypothetical protein
MLLMKIKVLLDMVQCHLENSYWHLANTHKGFGEASCHQIQCGPLKYHEDKGNDMASCVRRLKSSKRKFVCVA